MIKGPLTLFAQDAETKLILYSAADIQRSEADDQYTMTTAWTTEPFRPPQLGYIVPCFLRSGAFLELKDCAREILHARTYCGHWSQADTPIKQKT